MLLPRKILSFFISTNFVRAKRLKLIKIRVNYENVEDEKFKYKKLR